MNFKDKRERYQAFLLGKSIERCSDIIQERNRYNLNALAMVGLAMMSFSILFGWWMQDVFTFQTELLLLWGYFALMYLANRFMRIKDRFITVSFYIWMIPLMAMAIILGTFADPLEPSITIMVFICVIPLFILDKPWRVISFIIVTALVYTLCCFLAKDRLLFLADMIDLVLFGVMSIGINCLILKDRMTNVERAMNVKQLADLDALTKLYHRGAGEERIKALLASDASGMMILLDFDNFKGINDSYGHQIGDDALIALASCLKSNFRDEDVVMRLGGDEFAIYTPHILEKEACEKLLERLLAAVDQITIPSLESYRCSISIGVAISSNAQPKNFTTLYHESDAALYQSKRKGKHTYHVFA
ncbi:MAG: GGDEF domain-containing protein [Erysipelotrichaceae bacterium]